MLSDFFEAENLPVVVLEAMMFGTPVIATNWRGIPTIVPDGENGFLVPVRSPHKIADRLKILLENERLAREMGTRSRHIFVDRFTIEKFWERMESVFLEVAQQAR